MNIQELTESLLTKEQEKEVLKSLSKKPKSAIRFSKLIRGIKNLEAGQTLLDKNEKLENIQDPEGITYLYSIYEVFAEKDLIELWFGWADYEEELIKNSSKVEIQVIKESEEIEMDDFIPFIDSLAISSINYEKTNSIQSIIGSKGIKIKRFNPQILTSKVSSSSNEDDEKAIILPENVLEKTINFLKAKSIFISSRVETINYLKDLYNVWNDSEWRGGIALEAANSVGSLGSLSLTLGIPNVLADLIKSGTAFSKIRLIEKNSEEFQIILNDKEEDLKLLSDSYDNLYQLVKDKEGLNIFNLSDKNMDGDFQIFEKEFRLFEILSEKNIWRGKKHLSIKDVEEAINLLRTNVSDLKSERDLQLRKTKIDSKLMNCLIKELEINNEIKKIEKEIKVLFFLTEDIIKSKNAISSIKERKNKQRLNLLKSIVNSEISLDEKTKYLNELVELISKSKEKDLKEKVESIWLEQDKISEFKNQLKELEVEQSELQAFECKIEQK